MRDEKEYIKDPTLNEITCLKEMLVDLSEAITKEANKENKRLIEKDKKGWKNIWYDLKSAVIVGIAVLVIVTGIGKCVVSKVEEHRKYLNTIPIFHKRYVRTETLIETVKNVSNMLKTEARSDFQKRRITQEELWQRLDAYEKVQNLVKKTLEAQKPVER